MPVTKMLQALRLVGVLLVGVVLAIRGQNNSLPIYPAAMSMDYNPLLWRGEDAQFALDMLKGSPCTADLSETIAVKTKNRAVQDLALVMAHDQERFYKKLHNMARTFGFPLPPRQDDGCREDSRLSELSEPEADSNYVALLLKSTSGNVARFEAEVARPRGPENSPLWKLAQKSLPMIRQESEQVKTVDKAIKGHK